MPRIVLDLTDEELDALMDVVGERHADYCGEPLPDEEEEWEEQGAIMASLFDKVSQAVPEK